MRIVFNKRSERKMFIYTSPKPLEPRNFERGIKIYELENFVWLNQESIFENPNGLVLVVFSTKLAVYGLLYIFLIVIVFGIGI